MTVVKWGILVGVIVSLLGALLFGYIRYQAAKDAQDAAALKAAVDVARSENPFQADNPLSNVEADPFEKTKEILNPFE